MSSEWLFPDQRPFWDKSKPNMPFADCNWVSESKEDEEMSKKASTNQTATNNEQEDTVTKFDFPRKNDGSYDFNADKTKHATIRASFKVGRVKGIELTHAIEGKKLLGGLTDDPDELALLAKVAKKLGWCGRVLSVTQAEKYFGQPNPDFSGHGWLIKSKPRTSKAGHVSQFETVVYPIEAFRFTTESGEPEFNEQKAKATGRKNSSGNSKRTTNRKSTEKQVIVDDPIPAAAPAKLIHIKLANGVEFDARSVKEAEELKALFA